MPVADMSPAVVVVVEVGELGELGELGGSEVDGVLVLVEPCVVVVVDVVTGTLGELGVMTVVLCDPPVPADVLGVVVSSAKLALAIVVTASIVTLAIESFWKRIVLLLGTDERGAGRGTRHGDKQWLCPFLAGEPSRTVGTSAAC
jgi:hypothetical protein